MREGDREKGVDTREQVRRKKSIRCRGDWVCKTRRGEREKTLVLVVLVMVEGGGG